jgi:7-alpha-hydroxysteroid dehydrogenase
MSRPDSERVVATAMERFGRIDILVNNVGGSTYARFLDIADEDFRHTFDWCVTSAFIMSQLVAPHMIEASRGNIVNISSGAARFGIRALTAYCVAKGGLEALTRAMAQELAPKIRVNAIALGSFATEGLQGSLDMMPGSQEKMQEATPLHRLGDVADLGRLCVYLSTRDCYATNAIFHVDGGIVGARLIGWVGRVDEIVAEQVLCYVNDLMSSPEFDTAMHIDVMGLISAHGTQIW